ncbi:MAG: GxxExxY protein [Saprospiraceae bacterium]|jgi:GxxExxY protein
MSALIYEDKTYQIIEICMEVHSILGPGLLEIVYKDALEYEFKLNDIPYEREKEYAVVYKDEVLAHRFYAGFVVFGDIILEVKGKKEIADIFIAQTLNYMTLAESSVGLTANFGASSFQ